jgi:4-hydroxybenzoate polyprenyltransferase
MRGAGCTLNDIADRNFDGRVERTRLRPIPSGQVSVARAMAFLAALCLAGLAVLLQFNWFTVFTGAASLAIVAVYPFMKRITYWPQAVLGLAFNWGALVGWTAVHGALSAAPLLLYAGGIAWTLAYDTIYAHQDKEDDALIGLKSTALRLGDATIWWLGLFFFLALALIDTAIWLAGGSLIAHLGIAGAAMHAAWQLARFEPANSARCLELFRSNRIFGLIITSSLLLDSLLT